MISLWKVKRSYDSRQKTSVVMVKDIKIVRIAGCSLMQTDVEEKGQEFLTCQHGGT